MEPQNSQNKTLPQKVLFRELFAHFIGTVDLCLKEPRVPSVGTLIEDLKTIPDKLYEIEKQQKKIAKQQQIAEEGNLRAKVEELKKQAEELRTRERAHLADVKNILAGALKFLPGHYRENYSEPLLRNLESVQESSAGTLETLTAAIYDHSNSDFQQHLRHLLAFTSNIYRSFLQPERLPSLDFPRPQSTLPALATFNPDPDIDRLQFVPFTLPVDEVERLCGAKVALVSLPSCYRQHPVLSWGCIGHEVGGHDVLHSYPGLLQELRRGVRELFYQGQDPHDGKIVSDSQFLGILWQYWTEEIAADVYGVLNLGPSYGVALAIYFAALWERVRRYRRGLEKDGFSAITVSNLYLPPFRTTIDYHPTNVLALSAVIGAIDALTSLSEEKKKNYIKIVEDCIKTCLDENDEVVKRYNDSDVDHYRRDSVHIRGWLQLKSGSWIQIEPNQFRLPLDVMCVHARRVGYYIATAKMRAFNGHSIQDLETWDDNDEARAEEIFEAIAQEPIDLYQAEEQRKSRLINLGDDAQFFSGALFALVNDPQNYEIIHANLALALDASFQNDDIWGKANWHPIADEGAGGGPPGDAIHKM